MVSLQPNRRYYFRMHKSLSRGRFRVQSKLMLLLVLAQPAWTNSPEGVAEERRFCRYKFLLLDDEPLLESQNLRRKVNQAVKRAEPVLRLDAPWETDGDKLNYVSVIYDEEEQIFKMWYTLGRWQGETTDGPRGVAYATSKDGLRWEKPILGLVEANGSTENNMVISFKHNFVYSIIKDRSDIPARRYKMTFSTFGEEGLWAKHYSSLNLAYSHDGLRWERPRHVNPVLRGISDDNHTLFYDEDRRKYVLVTRRVPNVPRDISQYESYDLVNWEDKGRVLVAGDELDPPELYNLYDMPVFRYEGFFLGMITPYYVHPFAPTYAAYHKPKDYPKGKVGQLEISLAYSRDGQTWHRPDDRSPVVPIGKVGAQDGGMVIPAENPLVRDGETWIYYSASRLNHTWWDWLSYDRSQGMRNVAVLMLARMPEDHWVSLDAGTEEGWLMTKPWGPPYQIFVNADAEGGSIEAELISPYGDPIAGFTREESIPLREDETRQQLRWKSGRSPYDLSVEHFGGICLKLYLKQAKLYSYTFTLPDPDGSLSRNKANARWLDLIRHRSDQWGVRSTEPATGLSPHPRSQANPATRQGRFAEQVQEAARKKGR